MKRLLILLSIFAFSSISSADLQSLEQHGGTLYELVYEYVQTNSASSSLDVINYINSDATKTAFSDALSSGYQRNQVIFEAYQLSFKINPKMPVIIDGLHDLVAQLAVVQNAVFYTTWANVGVTATLLIGFIRQLYVYIRFDGPALTFYRTNNQDYLRTQLTHGTTVGAQNRTIPEPFF